MIEIESHHGSTSTIEESDIKLIIDLMIIIDQEITNVLNGIFTTICQIVWSTGLNGWVTDYIRGQTNL